MTAVLSAPELVEEQMSGKTLTLREGSTAHLPKGTVCVWNVIRPIRKVFFYRNG